MEVIRIVQASVVGAAVTIMSFFILFGVFSFGEWVLFAGTKASKRVENITLILIFLGLSYMVGAILLKSL